MSEEKAFNRQEALEICYEHYRERGCSEDDCHRFCDHLSDSELKRIVPIIKREDMLVAELYSDPRAQEIKKQMETCSLIDLPNLVNELQRFLKYDREQIQRILQGDD